MLVYLAGPITGCTYNGATDWRDAAKQYFSTHGITGLSPMRGKDYLKEEATIQHAYPQHSLSCARGITTRDRWDCTRVDVVLANLLGAQTVSIGTVIELGWADAHRIPVVGVLEPTGNPHDHPMVTEILGFRVATLDEALTLTARILTP